MTKQEILGFEAITDTTTNDTLYNPVRSGVYVFEFKEIQQVLDNIQWWIDEENDTHPCTMCGCDGSCQDGE